MRVMSAPSSAYSLILPPSINPRRVHDTSPHPNWSKLSNRVGSGGWRHHRTGHRGGGRFHAAAVVGTGSEQRLPELLDPELADELLGGRIEQEGQEGLPPSLLMSGPFSGLRVMT